jgi:hypothetical protein
VPPSGASRCAAILAGVLAVMGLAVLAQFILTSARRRRRDFAMLKVLDMLRRDLSAVAFWQVAASTPPVT